MESKMLDELVGQFALEKSLTKRETEILFLLIGNVTHLKEIADHLKLSRSTINNHLNNIYIKVNVKGKAQLLAQCFGYVSQKVSTVKKPSVVPRVLVVNDKESPRLILRDHLEEMGCAVMTTSSFSQARGFLEREEVDLILSDVSMPELDGFKVLREVRIKRPKYPMFMFDGPSQKMMK